MALAAFTAEGGVHLYAGSVTPTQPGVNGKASLGKLRGANTSWSDVTVPGQFEVTAAAAGNVATLTFSSGAVAQTTGTPTITGADATNGKDFEGNNLATLTTLYGIHVQCLTAGDVTISSSSTIGFGCRLESVDDAAAWPSVSGVTIASDTMTITLTDINTKVRVTYFGK